MPSKWPNTAILLRRLACRFIGRVPATRLGHLLGLPVRYCGGSLSGPDGATASSWMQSYTILRVHIARGNRRSSTMPAIICACPAATVGAFRRLAITAISSNRTLALPRSTARHDSVIQQCFRKQAPQMSVLVVGLLQPLGIRYADSTRSCPPSTEGRR